MAAKEGSIIIDSGILTDNFEKDAAKIVTSAKKTAATIDKTGRKMSAGYDKSALDAITKSADTAAKSTNQFRKEIQKAEKALKDLEDAGKWYGDEEFDKASQDLESLKAQVKDYKRELSRGTSDNTFASGSVSANLYEAQRNFDRVVSEGAGLGEAEYDNAYRELVKAKDAYTAYRKELTASKPVIKQEGDVVEDTAEEIEDYAEETEQAEKKTRNFSKAAAKMGTISKSVLGGIGKLGGAVGTLFSRSKATDASLTGAVKTIARYVFGIESLFFLAGKIRDLGAEGLSNLAKESDKTKENINFLKASVSTFSNAIASAFAPVLNIAVPALTTIANWAARAATHVGMLIAALTGQSTFKKAVSVQTNVANGFNETAEAAGKAKKAINEYLSPIDEINKISSQSGAAGGSSGGSLGNMFEDVPIENSVANLATKLKTFLAEGDWEGLGSYLADRLNVGMEKVYAVFSWKNAGPKIRNFTKKFTTTFNSFVKNLDAKKLGNVIGAGIDTIVRTVNGFVDNIEWKLLGQKFGESIEGIIDDIDGKEIGKFLGTKFRVAIQFLSGLVSTLPWGKIGTELGNAINGLFEGISPEDIAAIINGLITGSIDLVKNFVKTAKWGNVLDAIIDVFKGLNTEARIGVIVAILGTLLLTCFKKVAIGASLVAAVGILIVALKDKIAAGLKKIGNQIGDWFKDVMNGKGINAGGRKKVIDVVVNASKTKTFDNVLNDYQKIKAKNVTAAVKVSNVSKKDLDAVLSKYNTLKDKSVKVTLRYSSNPTGISRRIMRAVGLSTGGIYKFGKWQKIEGYASGGYPASSRLFYANENGMPELVGRIGSNTAVMNNGQIVASVAAGVYRAVAAAFGQLHNYFAIMSNSMQKLPEIMERFTNMFPSVNIPLPAVAQGSVVPPQTFYDSRDINALRASLDALKEEIRALRGTQGGTGTHGKSEYRITAYVGRKVLFDEVVSEAKLQQQITGKNPFDLN